MPKPLAALAALLLIAGAAAAESGAVEVSDAWARATPAKAETGAAYLTLKAAAGDRLVGLSTPVADKAELHEMTMDGSVMKMRQLASLDLPAAKAVVLKPHGTHIMLIGLHQPLKNGQSFPLTLRFDKAGAREVTVAIEKR
jgi:copper(I)-binding protein